MVRRLFLKTILFLPLLLSAKGSDKKDVDIWKVLEEVQEVIFPKSEYFVGAKSLGCTEYLREAFSSGFFRKLDKKLILSGARALELKYNFIQSKNKKEIIEKYIQEPEGKFWVSVLTEYTLEGAFCHPIYGGNRDKKGFKSIDFIAGNPEPKVRYGKHGRV